MTLASISIVDLQTVTGGKGDKPAVPMMPRADADKFTDMALRSGVIVGGDSVRDSVCQADPGSKGCKAANEAYGKLVKGFAKP